MLRKTRWSAVVVLASTAVFGVAAPASVVSLSGCFGHQCDASFVTLAESSGHLIDANTWESGPIDGDWVDYAPQRFTTVPLKMLGNRLPTSVLVYVSGGKRPVGAQFQSSFALGTGNLATISSVTTSAVQIHNDTCAQYYARFVITAAPQEPARDAGPALDAISPMDASDAK